MVNIISRVLIIFVLLYISLVMAANGANSYAERKRRWNLFVRETNELGPAPPVVFKSLAVIEQGEKIRIYRVPQNSKRDKGEDAEGILVIPHQTRSQPHAASSQNVGCMLKVMQDKAVLTATPVPCSPLAQLDVSLPSVSFAATQIPFHLLVSVPVPAPKPEPASNSFSAASRGVFTCPEPLKKISSELPSGSGRSKTDPDSLNAPYSQQTDSSATPGHSYYSQWHLPQHVPETRSLLSLSRTSAAGNASLKFNPAQLFTAASNFDMHADFAFDHEGDDEDLDLQLVYPD